MSSQPSSINFIDVYKITESIFGDSQHQKRIKSMANAALGVIISHSLIVYRMGRGLAEALGLSDRHAIKQIDRSLSNKKLNVSTCQEKLAPFLIGGRKEIKIILDWTSFDGDNQLTLSLSLVTSHGRSTLLLWKTVDKETLKDHQNDYEDDLLVQLRRFIPEDVKVTIIADRGFGILNYWLFCMNLNFITLFVYAEIFWLNPPMERLKKRENG